MPLYEYKCERCGTVCEVLQKAGETPPAACLKCGGPLRKMQSSPAIQFKGSGWYITDYARKGADGNGGKQGEAAAKDSETAKVGPSEPAAKPTPPAKPDPASSSD